MIQFVEQLRNQAKWYAQPGHNARDLMDSHLLEKAADEIECLRAKVEQMEQQEPVGVLHVGSYYGEELQDWEFEADQRVCDRLNERHVTNPTSLKLYALPGAQPAPSVPDDVVEQAVNRFLSWKLPKDFHPDGGMVFIPTKGRGYDSPHWPVGTNLLNAQQAREMLRYVLAAAPETKP